MLVTYFMQSYLFTDGFFDKFKRMLGHPIMQTVFIACVILGVVSAILTVFLIKWCRAKTKKVGPKEAEEGKTGFVQNEEKKQESKG
ncbi:hypothetical protein XENTR_v10002867 [Xenopus tropicalis]|nr:hypothetical protein XENTR_v10002867 [Xenopus tropicalis]